MAQGMYPAETTDAAKHGTVLRTTRHDRCPKGGQWRWLPRPEPREARGGEVETAGARAVAGQPLPCPLAATYLESFISICCRTSWRSSSVLLGNMFRSSSSCLLGRFLSLTASSSFLHFLGSVPRGPWRGQPLASCGLSLRPPPAGGRGRDRGGHCQLMVTSRGAVGDPEGQ